MNPMMRQMGNMGPPMGGMQPQMPYQQQPMGAPTGPMFGAMPVNPAFNQPGMAAFSQAPMQQPQQQNNSAQDPFGAL